MNLKKLIFIALGLALLSGIYVYVFVWNKDHPDYEELKADHSMTAEQLYTEFTTDGAASSAKYNGKMIELAGEVSSVETVDNLTIAVFVFNEGMFGDEGIRCTFLNQEGSPVYAIEDLNGKKIKGFCTGYNDTDVILEKCSLTN